MLGGTAVASFQFFAVDHHTICYIAFLEVLRFDALLVRYLKDHVSKAFNKCLFFGAGHHLSIVFSNRLFVGTSDCIMVLHDSQRRK